MIRFVCAIAATTLLGSCGPETTTTDDGDSTRPVLSYSNAFVMAPIAGRDVTMGGVVIAADGGDVRLVGASSPAVATIELHTMRMTDSRMQMRKVDGFDIEDGETLVLDRGTHHMMMFGVDAAEMDAGTVDITLNFEADGAPLTLVVTAEIRAVGE